jgi:outer membrane protein assembly factor BamA
VLHYGRYGADGEDPRLTPLFIGYPTLVRGYDIGSFTPAECGLSSTGGCPAFDRLVGSRMLVGNLEFRFPLLRPFGLRSGMYGPIPAELAFFADAGMAWTREPGAQFGDRELVRSAGIALRFNALGFAILQLDYVRPFDRPGKGWLWQFSLAPGF